ncbi:MAG: SDR family NAD(P)-dependent oxidoreductase [Myxococcales bacterium]|nr:SDR family NAD(P)-dependent oxidoreductase [Myxococcales bacterium]
MKILVTGGTGFIGSHSAAALTRAGHDVRLLVRDAEKAKRTFESLGTAVPETVTGDVTDADAVGEALEGCEGVLHAAALVSLDASRAEQVARTNFGGTKNVVGMAQERGLGPIVYVSSVSALFDPGKGRIGPDSAPSHQAGNAYSASKARTEAFVRGLQAAGAPVAITYPSGVLGPHAPSLTEVHRALPVQLRVGLLTEGGIAFVDVRDVAAAHAAIFARAPGPSRFITSSHDLTWHEVADLLGELTGRRIRRVRVPGPLLRGFGRLGDLAKRFVSFDFPLTYEGMTTATRWPGVDASATERELGVSFRHPRETLADTLRWMGEAGHVAPEPLGHLAPAGRPRLKAG